jgi:hypothetical protein
MSLHFDGVLLVAELNTSWFDLKNYEKLGELDIVGWHKQIALRSFFLSLIDHLTPKSAYEQIGGSCIDQIKTNPIFTNETIKFMADVQPTGLSTVNYTKAFDFWSIVNSKELDNIWSCCALSDIQKLDPDQQQLTETPASILVEGSNGYHPFPYITINTEATDQQIMDDFRVFLAEHRKMNTETQLPQKNFTERDLRNWVKDRLLPYIDLYIVTSAEDQALTHIAAANLLWSDEVGSIDTVDKIRRTTKPKAIKLLNTGVAAALEAQIECMAQKNKQLIPT